VEHQHPPGKKQFSLEPLSSASPGPKLKALQEQGQMENVRGSFMFLLGITRILLLFLGRRLPREVGDPTGYNGS